MDTEDEGQVPGSSQPLVELTCATDAAACIFAAFVKLVEDDAGRKNVFTLDTACTVHKKSGSTIPTLAVRTAGSNLLSATMDRVRSAHSRAATPAPQAAGPRGRMLPNAAFVPSMTQVSRLRWTKSADEPNLPKAPPAASPTEPLGDVDDIEQYLEALRPGMGIFAKNLRALGVDTVDTLLTLEEDEWSTLMALSHHSDPPLSQPYSKLLYDTIAPVLVGRS